LKVESKVNENTALSVAHMVRNPVSSGGDFFGSRKRKLTSD